MKTFPTPFMTVFLFLSLLLGVCQCEPLDKMNEEANVLLPERNSEVNLKKDNLMEENLNLDLEERAEEMDIPWWLEEEQLERNENFEVEEEEEMEEEEAVEANDLRATCPARNTLCHSVGGLCYSRSANTRYCEIVSKDPKVCNSTSCQCCIDCDRSLVGSQCRSVRGYCRGECQCRPYEYSDAFHPCRSSACSCCRRCLTTRECRYGRSYGVCVGDANYYSRFHHVYRNYTASCTVPGCSCINVCTRERSCYNAGGYCTKLGIRCRPNYIRFPCGCRDDRNCACCVPLQNRQKALSYFKCKEEN
ncbi:hypothetical protein Pcinc_037088 [Petrolisthes cinctipes]|uniref:Uncharacterized protein n=1 Tax=Petrolisthes cinctipes TaxID=88211 RepID=A0AAE1BX90_PETCI|nr:hypothetical protein Pcinc_037088 [Petrolisthes cinctipes]